ncbi:Retrovirus-related Pol polyprotein, partial [Mucuna pruriens]
MPIRKQQRRMNLTILDVVKKEVTKLLPVGIIYPILDNQVFEKLAGKSHYCFLDGFSRYMQIHIALEDQHKTTSTCPIGTFAYIGMPFGMCNVSTFRELKSQLTSAPILQAPNWEFPFELMCDASNSALGAVLGQRVGVGKPVHVISYASRTMDPTQLNYSTIEKELLAIKPNAKPRLIQWMLLLQQFNIEIKDKKGAKNSIADHLSRIEKEADPMPIRDEFQNGQLLHITTPTPWFADICNFVAAS